MPTHARRERLLLTELLESAGPEAPTLCEGWTTRDLAAHLVVRERRGEAVGVLLKPLAEKLEQVRREYAARPYEELLRLFRTGPGRMSPFAWKQVDEAANTVEFFLHGEDVRRARPDWSPRAIDPVFGEALWKRVRPLARLAGRRAPVGLVLRRPDGQTVVARNGTPVVTVTGEPPELLVFLSGRQSAARVELEGDAEAVTRAREAPLGI